MKKLLVTLTLALLLAFASLARAQSTTYGRLEGVVGDAQGGVLPGVTVTLYRSPVMGERTVTTELDGRYMFRALDPRT